MERFSISKEEYDNLKMLVPHTVFLPVDPIRLTRDQSQTLSKIIYNDVAGVDPEERYNRYKTAYVDTTQLDMGQTGFCDIQLLHKALLKNKVELHPDTFRLVAAQYVDSRQQGKVDYNSFYKCIARALDMGNTQAVYRNGSLSQERMVAKVLHEVQGQLLNYRLDVARWRQAFEAHNSPTLLLSQMKDICYNHHLPFGGQLLNRTLKLFEDPERDGHVSWRPFLDFLQKAVEGKTSILQHTPESNFDQPVGRRYDVVNDQSRDYNYGQQPPSNAPPRQEDRNDRHNDGGPVPDTAARTLDEHIREVSHRLFSLEERNRVIRQGLEMADRDWVDRFTKMANALYQKDHFHKESLHRHEVLAVFDLYNKAFNLKMDNNLAHQLVNDPRLVDRSGNVNLNQFLLALKY